MNVTSFKIDGTEGPYNTGKEYQMEIWDIGGR